MEGLLVPGTEVISHSIEINGKNEDADGSACFNIGSGDVEDAPAGNALNKFNVFEKDGAVYIRGTEADIKAGQRNPVTKCSVSQPMERVVIIGG